MRKILLIILILAPLTLSAQLPMALYKGGYWGSWQETYNSFQKTVSNGDDFGNKTITIYPFHGHPADFSFRMKFNVNSAVRNEKGWYEVQGEVEYNTSWECIDFGVSMEKRYSGSKASFLLDKKYVKNNANKKAGKGKLRGTINVFYENRGRAFRWE